MTADDEELDALVERGLATCNPLDMRVAINALRQEVKRWHEIYADACVSLVPIVPAFGGIPKAAQKIAEEIRTLRARVAELEQQIAEQESDICLLEKDGYIWQERALAAESQLQQVKADAERMRAAMNLVLKHAGKEVHLGPARLSGIEQGCIACIAYLALDGADKEYFDEALARSNDGTA